MYLFGNNLCSVIYGNSSAFWWRLGGVQVRCPRKTFLRYVQMQIYSNDFKKTYHSALNNDSRNSVGSLLKLSRWKHSKIFSLKKKTFPGGTIPNSSIVVSIDSMQCWDPYSTLDNPGRHCTSELHSTIFSHFITSFYAYVPVEKYFHSVFATSNTFPFLLTLS